MTPSFPNLGNYSNSDYPKSSLTLISEYQKLMPLLESLIGAGMQSTNWAPEHSDALREYLAKGMSYSEVADAINAKFETAYSRSAAIGRAKRMGLAGPKPPADLPRHWPGRPPEAKAPPLRKHRERHPPEFMRPMPFFERTEATKLRCVEIAPRHLSLIDLEPGDCRYPYGGDEDGEAITFCGHPRRLGSSYCTPHFHLTRGPGITLERAASTVSLRLVAAA
jgi:GcrA cell cycle regulator